MSYEAIICEIEVSEHPNADRLRVATANGYQCVVGLEHESGEIGVLFPEGGQLSEGFCLANELYRKHPRTGEPMGGYLDESRRVRAVKLRGVESNALWLPMSALRRWILEEGDMGLRPGDRITHVGGHELCRKYLTPATVRAMQSRDPSLSKKARYGTALRRHYDTGQLRDAQMPTGGILIVTEKLHGTSGRTGHVQVEKPQGWLTRTLNRLPWVSIKPEKEWKIISGTRNCILDPDATGEKAKGFRFAAHRKLAPHIRRGETWYYELVGYEAPGRPIMPPHKIEKIGDAKLEKSLKKAAGGDQIVYHYGCEDGDFAIYVYRIEGEDGGDLPWRDMAIRAARAGVEAPPVLWYAFSGTENFDALTRGRSRLGGVPIKEGICVRYESADGTDVRRAVKHKGFVFCALEGIRKNDPEYVDTEEAA